MEMESAYDWGRQTAIASPEWNSPEMSCPRCGQPAIQPAPASGTLVAWYICPSCGHEWSVRLRGGRIDPGSVIHHRHP
jgi:predicted RNA-binding Zn-ribbon protein involved in translation (DUF1610 family)